MHIKSDYFKTHTHAVPNTEHHTKMKTFSLSLVFILAFSDTLANSSPKARATACLLKCPAGDVCIADPTPRCAVPDG